MKLPARRRNHCTYVTWIMWLLYYYYRYLCNIITSRLIESPLIIFTCMLLLLCTPKDIEKKRTNSQWPAAVVIRVRISRLPNIISTICWGGSSWRAPTVGQAYCTQLQRCERRNIISNNNNDNDDDNNNNKIIILIIIDPPRAMALASELKQLSENDDYGVYLCVVHTRAMQRTLYFCSVIIGKREPIENHDYCERAWATISVRRLYR